MLGDRVCLIICSGFPLAIVLSPFKKSFTEALLRVPVVLIEAECFDDKVYSLDKKIAEQIFQRQLSPNISYEALSINDLWWATI